MMTDSMYINIREATPEDAEQIHALMHASQQEMENASMYIIGSPKKIRQFLGEPGSYGYVAADADGEIVSFALFATYRPGPRLTTDIPQQLIQSKTVPYDMDLALRCVNFATKSEYRSLGIAHHLIATGLEHGSILGCESIWTLIDPRNDVALRMMARHGLRIHATAGGFASVGKGYMSYSDDETNTEPLGRYAVTRNILCGAIRR